MPVRNSWEVTGSSSLSVVPSEFFTTTVVVSPRHSLLPSHRGTGDDPGASRQFHKGKFHAAGTRVENQNFHRCYSHPALEPQICLLLERRRCPATVAISIL